MRAAGACAQAGQVSDGLTCRGETNLQSCDTRRPGAGWSRAAVLSPHLGRKSGGISLHVCSLKEGPQGPEETFLCGRRFAQQGVQEGFLMPAL